MEGELRNILVVIFELAQEGASRSCYRVYRLVQKRFFEFLDNCLKKLIFTLKVPVEGAFTDTRRIDYIVDSGIAETFVEKKP